MSKKSSKTETKTKKAKAAETAAPKAATTASEPHVETPTAAATDAKPTKKTGKKAKAPKERKSKKLSALDAAAQVLAEATQPMTCPELIDAMARRKLWESPNGQTPAATLYAAMCREINAKGKEARFKKTGRGTFAAAGK